jgi:T5SS/PEP-CTERM-associated repeat protein
MRRKIVRALAMAAIGTSVCSSDGFSAIRTWNAPNGGTWSTPATNWLGGVVPVSGDSAVFDLSDSYTVDFIANVTNVGLVVRNDTVTFDLGGFSFGTSASSLAGGGDGDVSRLTITNGTLTLGASTTLGAAAGLRQTLTVSNHGTLTSTAPITIGSLGDGSLLVSNGGDINVATVTIGANSAATGTISISGLNSSMTVGTFMTVGSLGPGVLNVTGGGSIDTSGNVFVGSTAGGSITISGSDSKFTTSGTVFIGTSGLGTMRIDSGASASCGTVSLGFTTAGRGGIGIVDGADSVWTTGPITVGTNTTGSLLISNGARMSSSTISIGNGGLGSKATVTGFGTKWNGGQMFVGQGSEGALEVLAGAQLFTTASSVGSLSAANGVAHVGGGGSHWDANGNVDIGAAGIGNVTVDGGGVFTPNTLVLGTNSSGYGTANVSDAGSAITTATLTIGATGTGVMTVENGGHVTASNLVVGQGGDGNLIIQNGGFVSVDTAGTLSAGTTSTGHGDITVTGPGSTLNAGTFILGQSSTIPGGTAAITVSNGGVVNTTNHSFFTQNAIVTIDGGTVNAPAGLTLSSQTDLFAGAIDVGRDGTLNIFGRVSLHSTAARLSGGTITLNSNFARITGSGRIYGVLTTPSGSEISVGAGEELLVFPFGGDSSIGGRLTLTDGGVVDFGFGQVNLTTTGRLSGRGTLKSGLLTNNGTISLSGGSSDVFGTVTNNSTSRVFVTGNSVATFYDDLTNNAGSIFQVSAGSTAVFFGNVSGLGAFTGTGIKDFEGGTSVNGGLQTNTGDTIVGGPATVSAGFIREHALTLSGRMNILPDGSNAGVSRLNQLIIDGDTLPIGTLDLNNNDLVIDYGTNETSPRSTVQSQISFARHGGAWDANGITSSAARDHPQHATTLGLLEASEYKSIYGPSALFSGQTIDATAVLVKYTWYGDTDFNGKVNFDDYVRTDNGFNNHLAGWLNGDFDGNGQVNFDDYVLIDLAFNTQSGTLGRALAFADGSDRTLEGMDAGPLLAVHRHFERFGESYLRGLIAAVPEPCAASIALGCLFTPLLARTSAARARRTSSGRRR